MGRPPDRRAVGRAALRDAGRHFFLLLEFMPDVSIDLAKEESGDREEKGEPAQPLQKSPREPAQDGKHEQEKQEKIRSGCTQP